METIIVKAQGEKLRALKAFLSALNMQFQNANASIDNSDVFSHELDKKIKKAREERQRGEVITVTPENLWESI